VRRVGGTEERELYSCKMGTKTLNFSIGRPTKDTNGNELILIMIVMETTLLIRKKLNNNTSNIDSVVSVVKNRVSNEIQVNLQQTFSAEEVFNAIN
jgi:hypothetical protein